LSFPAKVTWGIVAGRPNLSPSTKDEFDGKSAKLKLQDMEKMAKDIADDEKELAEKAAKTDAAKK
jgi:hypothetical protein